MSWPRPPAICPPPCWRAWPCRQSESGKPAVNAAVLLDGGRLLLEQHKRLLPFYDVFDEQRYFAPSRPQQVVELDGLRLAITICEDAWNDKNFWPRRLYTVDPVEELMRQQPAVHINLSSSPFWHGKRATSPPDAARPLPGGTACRCCCATRWAATTA